MADVVDGKDLHPPPMQMSYRIYSLLCEGWERKKVAGQLEISYSLVRKYADKFEREGKIKRFSNYPVQYMVSKQKTQGFAPPPIGSVPFGTNLPLALPHRFGCVFSYRGEVKGRDVIWSKGLFTVKGRDVTFQFSRWKCLVWVKSGFVGKDTIEVEKSARELLLGYGELLGQRYQVALHFSKWLENVEWVFPDKSFSRKVAEALEVVKEPKVVAGVNVVFNDRSDPNCLEFNKAEGFSERLPTSNTNRFEYLIRRAPEDIAAIIQNQVMYNKNIEEHLGAIKDIRDSNRELVGYLKELREEQKKKR